MTALLAATLAGVGPDVAQAQTTSGDGGIAVAMGDSFISGEAGRWQGNSNHWRHDVDGTDRAAQQNRWGWWQYLPATVYGSSHWNACHRSDVSPITWIDEGVIAGVDEVVNLACSGAETHHITTNRYRGEDPQVDQLQALVDAGEDVDIVVLSIGGNDLGFLAIVASCTAAYILDTPPCVDLVDILVDQNMAGARQGITDSIQAIKAVLDSDVDDVDGYRIVLQSVPSPVPDGDSIRYDTRHQRINVGRCPLQNRDADHLRNDIVPLINSTWADIAATEGIEFLDLVSIFDGKALCSEGAEQGSDRATAEWSRMFLISPFQNMTYESIHPNALGQEAMGTCLALHLAADPADGSSRCTRVGETPDQMAID